MSIAKATTITRSRCTICHRELQPGATILEGVGPVGPECAAFIEEGHPATEEAWAMLAELYQRTRGGGALELRIEKRACYTRRRCVLSGKWLDDASATVTAHLHGKCLGYADEGFLIDGEEGIRVAIREHVESLRAYANGLEDLLKRPMVVPSADAYTAAVREVEDEYAAAAVAALEPGEESDDTEDLPF
jgi:hypothetical protein